MNQRSLHQFSQHGNPPQEGRGEILQRFANRIEGQQLARFVQWQAGIAAQDEVEWPLMLNHAQHEMGGAADGGNDDLAPGHPLRQVCAEGARPIMVNPQVADIPEVDDFQRFTGGLGQGA